MENEIEGRPKRHAYRAHAARAPATITIWDRKHSERAVTSGLPFISGQFFESHPQIGVADKLYSLPVGFLLQEEGAPLPAAILTGQRRRATVYPGVDRLRQHCDVFILQWIGWKGWLCGGSGAKADIFQTGRELLQLCVLG